MKTNSISSFLAILGLSICTAAALGCSDADSGGEADAGSLGSSASTCTAAWERELSCGATYEESDFMASCNKRYTCLQVIHVPEFAAAYWPCANQRACGEHDDECGLAVQEERYKDPSIKALADTCFEKSESCGEGFFEDYCAVALTAKPELVEGFGACVAKPCDQFDGCVEAWAEAQGCHSDTTVAPPAP